MSHLYYFVALAVLASLMGGGYCGGAGGYVARYSVLIVFGSYPVSANTSSPLRITGSVEGVLEARFMVSGGGVRVETRYLWYRMRGFGGAASSMVEAGLRRSVCRVYPLDNRVPGNRMVVGDTGVVYYVDPGSLGFNGSYSGVVVVNVLVNRSGVLESAGFIREHRWMRYDPSSGFLVELRVNNTVVDYRENTSGYEYIEMRLVWSNNPSLEYYAPEPLVAAASASAALWGAAALAYRRYRRLSYSGTR